VYVRGALRIIDLIIQERGEDDEPDED
jgi:hypothetical protein